MSTRQAPRNERACKDCLAALPEQIRAHPVIRGLRPAPYPGPRCASHHREVTRERKVKAHRNKTENNFGLPPGGYDRLLEAQDGRCGGCGKTPGPAARRMAVDHDHTCCASTTSCGRCVRGLLCYDCNTTLAIYGDSSAKLRRLAEYLVNWPSRKVTW